MTNTTNKKFPYRADNGVMMLADKNRYDAENQINASVIFMVSSDPNEGQLRRDFQAAYCDKANATWKHLQKQIPGIGKRVDMDINRGTIFYNIMHKGKHASGIPLLVTIGNPTSEYSVLLESLRILDNSGPTPRHYNYTEHEWEYAIPWNTKRVLGHPYSDMGFLDDTFFRTARNLFIAEDDTEHVCVVTKKEVVFPSLFQNQYVDIVVFRQFATIVEKEI